MKITRIGLVANVKKREIRDVVSTVLALVPRNVAVCGLEETAKLATAGAVTRVESLTGCDAVIALGGDGTIIKTAKKLAAMNVPVLGVNLGSLGFLTEIKVEDLFTYGMVPQFIARFDNVVLLSDLGVESLKQILLASLDSPFVRSRAFLEVMGINLELEDLAAAIIAEQARKHSRTGARALRTIFSKIINPIEFDPESSEAMIYLALIHLMLRRLQPCIG
jgi:hypothetical protein